MNQPPENTASPPKRNVPRGLLPAVVLLGVLPLLLCPVHFPVDAEFWERLMDAGHLPLFAVLTGVVYALLPIRTLKECWRLGWTVLTAALLAGFIEIIQPFAGRTGSWVDFRNGLFGVFIGAGGLALWRRRAKGGWIVYLAATAALSAMALHPAWEEWQGIAWRHKHFPLLGDFESATELRLWLPQGGSESSPTTIRIAAANPARGQHSLRLQTGTGSWAGTSYSAGDKDWSGYRALAWDVFNPGGPFTLSLRVDDDGDCSRFGQRYDNSFPIKPGLNQLRVTLAELERGPQTRRLNLRAVRRAAFFTGPNEPAREFYLDHVRLE